MKIKTMKDLFNWYKRKRATNFFDYPAYMQKYIVVNAIKGANEMQLAVVKEYDKKYLKKRG